MKTVFYKILYRNKDVVYVGVTTRKVIQRFKEHLKFKGLNLDDYSVIEFDSITHPEINSLKIFYEERRKVYELEKKYINEELMRGSNLLNFSEGGEWGSHILNKLKEEEFLREFGSYSNYVNYKKSKKKFRNWFYDWIQCRSNPVIKAWIVNWIHNKGMDKFKRWLQSWIYRRSMGETEKWLRTWVHCRSMNNVKVWLRSWIKSKNTDKTKKWLQSWVYCRSMNKTKRWIKDWIKCRRK